MKRVALGESKNAQALASLDEVGDELIALHHLEVPNTLHKNLLSTNIIENGIRNVRGTTGRVTRWQEETEQAARWMGLAVTRAEKGFRKLTKQLSGRVHDASSSCPFNRSADSLLQ